MKTIVLLPAALLLLSLILNACTGKKESSSSARQPNVIYIISDDQGWTDYSFMGHAYIETPNICSTIRQVNMYLKRGK